ncbi:conserved protein, unknown function [Hepatocystis sp. ex Piliocolobus tephrosceles]|nr:conserved protein, unknown function [Hepatocystis sp. ex Piliocolobus tephrosceles]
MLIEKYDKKPKFDKGFTPFYFISYPLYNIQCRSILQKYLNSYDEGVHFNYLMNANNLNIKTYAIYIFNSLHQIYSVEGIKGLYNGLIPMIAYILSKKTIYYFLEKIHFSIQKKKKNKKRKDTYNHKSSVLKYENKFIDEKENTNNFIGDNLNYKVVKYMNFVKEENILVKKKKKKKFFYLSFYHSLYEYISSIVAYPLLNISTKLIIFQDNTKSLFYNLKNITQLTYKIDGVSGFFKGLNNYLIIQSLDKVLNCFLYKLFSSNYSYNKVITIKVVLTTCLNTIIAPYIQYSMLNRSQSQVLGLCKDTSFNEFFSNYPWKSHVSNVTFCLAVTAVQLMIFALIPKDTTKNDDVINEERDE